MNYFQVVGLFFGFFTLTLMLFWVFILSKSNELAEKIMPEKKPFWLTVFSWIIVFILVMTWLLLLGNANTSSVLITVIMTFTIFKFVGIFLHYDWFRKTYFDIMREDIRAFYAVMFTTSILSLMLIYLCLKGYS